MAKNVTKDLLRIIHLPAEASVDRVVTHAHSYEVFLSFPPAPRLCPLCGSTDCVIKDSGRDVTVRHSSFSGSAVLLTFHQRRLLCKDCHASFSDRPYWLHPGLRMTMSLYLDICRDLCTPRPLSDIAKERCVSVPVVRSVLEHIDFVIPPRLPSTLCIDEFKGDSGDWDPDRERWSVQKFHTNIADGDSGCVVDIVEKTDLRSLYEYFFSFPLSERQKVKFFCCDMHGGYLSLAKRCFPNAAVCIDMFHVVRLLSDNVDEIRRALQNRLRDEGRSEEYQILKRSMRLLRTAQANQLSYWEGLYEQRKHRLDAVLSLSDDLREAYDALQGFLSILRLSLPGLRREALSDWIRTYAPSGCPGVRRCVNTVRHYRSYIQNTWKYQKSNGPCEGLNKRIKDIKRNSYGVHSFRSFRNRILFVCGHLRFVEECFTVSAEKKTRFKKEDIDHEK